MKEIFGEKLYTLKEAAQIINVHPVTLFKWKQAGKIKSRKIGRLVFISEDSIREFVGKDSGGEPKDGSKD